MRGRGDRAAAAVGGDECRAGRLQPLVNDPLLQAEVRGGAHLVQLPDRDAVRAGDALGASAPDRIRYLAHVRHGPRVRRVSARSAGRLNRSSCDGGARSARTSSVVAVPRADRPRVGRELDRPITGQPAQMRLDEVVQRAGGQPSRWPGAPRRPGSTELVVRGLEGARAAAAGPRGTRTGRSGRSASDRGARRAGRGRTDRLAPEPCAWTARATTGGASIRTCRGVRVSRNPDTSAVKRSDLPKGPQVHAGADAVGLQVVDPAGHGGLPHGRPERVDVIGGREPRRCRAGASDPLHRMSGCAGFPSRHSSQSGGVTGTGRRAPTGPESCGEGRPRAREPRGSEPRPTAEGRP